MMGRLSSKSFLRDTRAVSAIEFAVIFPALLVLMLGGIQLVIYINAVRKVELLASSISEMISQAAPPSTQTTTATVNQLDIHFGYDSTLVIFPYVMKDAARKNVPWWQNISISFASIQFTQNSNACDGQSDQSTCYSANVVWTSIGTNGSNYRPCLGSQQPTTSTTPSRYTLPANVFGSGSIIVVDIFFDFTPTFGQNIFGTQRISRSVYVQPRYAALVDYDMTNNDGIATKCLL